jgi:RES domain-containing protein
MTFLWRVSRYASLDGAGGLRYASRWNSVGLPITYLAESPAGAVLETLVHLELDRAPDQYSMMKVSMEDSVSSRSISERELASGWIDDSSITRRIGDEWLAAGESALLRVPSAIVPETANVLLNPAHGDAKRLKIVWHRAYPWDRRLF